jgi:hypothetical protein
MAENFFAAICKVNDEKSRIRIHPKMSWIRNTDHMYIKSLCRQQHEHFP